MDRELISTSKFLSLVLRHQPETIDIALDDQGWVEIDVLLAAAIPCPITSPSVKP